MSGACGFFPPQVFAPPACIGAKWSLTIEVFAPLASYPPPAAALVWGDSAGSADEPDSFSNNKKNKKGRRGADLTQVSIPLPLDNPSLLDAYRNLYLFAHMTLEAQE